MSPSIVDRLRDILEAITEIEGLLQTVSAFPAPLQVIKFSQPPEIFDRTYHSFSAF